MTKDKPRVKGKHAKPHDPTKPPIPPVTARGTQVTNHPKLTDIDRDLILKIAIRREIAEKYNLDYDAIYRRAQYLDTFPDYKRDVIAYAKLEKMRHEAAQNNEESLEIASMYNALAKRVEKMIDAAEKAKEPGLALAAAEGLRKVLKDIATMQGKLAQTFRVEMTISDSREWQELKDILATVFQQHPDAQATFLAAVRDARITGIVKAVGRTEKHYSLR